MGLTGLKKRFSRAAAERQREERLTGTVRPALDIKAIKEADARTHLSSRPNEA